MQLPSVRPSEALTISAARKRRSRANTPSGLPTYTLPQVVAGIKIFDGNGNFSQRDYIGDSLRTMNQKDFSPKGQETGTYTVNSNCTGSMVINLNAPVPMGSTGVINIMFVISDGGRHIHEVVSEFTPPGSTTGPAAHPNQCRRLEGRVGSVAQLTRLGRMACYISRRAKFWRQLRFFADLTCTGTARNSDGTARVLAVPSSAEPAATQDFCRKRDVAG